MDTSLGRFGMAGARALSALLLLLAGMALMAALVCAQPCAYAEEASRAGDFLQAAAKPSVSDDAVDEEARRAALVASMAVIDDGLYNIRSAAYPKTAFAIAGDSVKRGARLETARRSYSSWSQKFAVVQDAHSGCYKIRNLRSRLFLTVKGQVKKGGVVVQAAGGATLKQQWRLVKSKGAIQFRSAANPKYALTLRKGAKGAFALALRKASGSASQRFRVRQVDPLEGGQSYFIRSAKPTKLAVAVKGASAKKSARLVLDRRRSVDSQKFRIEKLGAAWRLQCVHSSLYVNASKKVPRQVGQSRGRSVKWGIELDLDTCTFAFKSMSTGRYLDSSKGALAFRPRAKTPSTIKSQRFKITPTYGFSVFLDAGHGRNAAGWGVYDPGAQGCGYDEADLTKDLVNRIEDKLAGTDIRVFNGSDCSVPYWERNSKARALGCDAILSVHFDAGGASSTSTMLGTRGATGSSAFNSIIHRKLVSSIGLRDGGTSWRSDITVVNGSVPSVLVEVCFIDNYSSLHAYLGRRDSVARSLAEGIVEASRLSVLHR